MHYNSRPSAIFRAKCRYGRPLITLYRHFGRPFGSMKDDTLSRNESAFSSSLCSECSTNITFEVNFSNGQYKSADCNNYIKRKLKKSTSILRLIHLDITINPPRYYKQMLFFWNKKKCQFMLT